MRRRDTATQNQTGRKVPATGISLSPADQAGLEDLAQIAARLCDAVIGLVLLEDDFRLSGAVEASDAAAIESALRPALRRTAGCARAERPVAAVAAVDAALAERGLALRVCAAVPVGHDGASHRGWIVALDPAPKPDGDMPDAALAALGRQAEALLMLPELTTLRARHEAIEQRYSRVLGNVTGMVYRVRGDDEWTIDFVSEGSAELLGLSPEALTDGTVSAAAFVHPDDIAAVRGRSAAAVAPGADGRLDTRYRLLLDDGTVRWVWNRSQALRRPDGTVDAFEGFLLDITAQRIAEAKLRETEATLRLFIREAPVALAILDGELRYLEVSQRWEALFGLPRDTAQGQLQSTIFPDMPERWKHEYQRALGGESISSQEDHWLRADGSSCWFRRILRPWHNAEGEIGGIIVFTEDVTSGKISDSILRMLSFEDDGLGHEDFLRMCTRRLSEILEVDWVHVAQPVRDAEGWMETLAIWSEGRAAPNSRYRLDGTPCQDAMAMDACLYPSGVQQMFPQDLALAEMNMEAYGGILIKGRGGNLLGLLSVMSRKPLRHSNRMLAGLRLAAIGIGAALERRRAETAIKESEQFNRSLLDALNAEVGVLDSQGEIVFLNQSWINFVAINNLRASPSVVGANYLKICDVAGQSHPEARMTGELVRAVLSGARSEGSFEYPSSIASLKSKRWFRCTVKGFVAPGGQFVMVVYEDVTEAKMAQRRSDRVQQQFQHLFQSAPDAIVMVDNEGQILLANRRCTDMFGYSGEELVGQPIEMLIAHHDPARHVAPRERFIDTLKSAAMDDLSGTLSGLRRDGSEFPAEFSLSRFAGEEAEYIIASVRDISVRLQAQEDRMARQVAEEANQAKSVFLATMSHEIRTPLSAVLGLADVLNQSTLSRDQAQLVSNMRDSADHLLHLIDDVLDFSKIEAGSLELESTSLDLHALIEATVRALANFAAERGVDLHLFVSPQLPHRVLADEVRLRQIIYNLLGNAIKFSSGVSRRQARAILRAEVADDGEGMVLSFHDNGIGMTEEVKAKLFRPFTQGEETTTRKFGGTGLGLTICLRIIERMKGTITVASDPGIGSSFVVHLPLQLADDDDAQQRAPRLVGLSCVVLDSEQYLAEDVQAMLEAEGAQVERLASDTGLPAASDAGIVAPDSVMILGSDNARQAAFPASMPRVEIGHDGSRRLAIRGRGRVFIESRAMTRDDLATAVALASTRENVAVEGGTFEPTGDDGPRARFPAATGPILVAEDDPMNQKVILRQLELLGLRGEIAEDGAQALEMWQAGGYALLLSDLHMPNMDGYALTASIRAREAELGLEQRLPILALTANALRDEVSRARNAGFDGFLTKPISLGKLAEALQPWLAAQHRGASDGKGAAAQAAGAAIDASQHAELIGTDPAAVNDFLRAYQAISADLVEKFADAVGAGDAESAAMIVHRLKSSSRWIGAGRLGDLCEALETAARGGDTGLLARRVAEFRRQHAEVDAEIERLCATGLQAD
ncbi:MAG: PAS domain S-box protein [Pararhodobacter sp.]